VEVRAACSAAIFLVEQVYRQDAFNRPALVSATGVAINGSARRSAITRRRLRRGAGWSQLHSRLRICAKQKYAYRCTDCRPEEVGQLKRRLTGY
jgi:hypothetical protein